MRDRVARIRVRCRRWGVGWFGVWGGGRGRRGLLGFVGWWWGRSKWFRFLFCRWGRGARRVGRRWDSIRRRRPEFRCLGRGGKGGRGWEGPAAPRQWWRFGSGRGGANFDDEHAADGIAVGGESLVKPGEQRGHAVVVGVAAVHGVDLSAGNVGTRGGRNVRKSGGEAGGGDEGKGLRGELGGLGGAQGGAAGGG